MNIYKLAKIGAVVGLTAVAVTARAVEHLRLTLQGPNAALTWSTIDGSGATYIVQYRSTLDATNIWQTLTADYPAATGTNLTCFIHTNAVKHPVNSGAASAPAVTVKSTQPSQVMGGSSLALARQTLAAVPTVRPADGSGSAVSLALYPPGVDLTGFLITDPATGTTLNGTKTTTSSPQSLQALSSGPVPGGGKSPAGNPGDVVSAPETGFYRVVRDGVTLLDSSLARLTNGVLSDHVLVAFEAGNALYDGTGTNVLGDLESAVLLVDGVKLPGTKVLGQNSFPWQFDLDTAYLENGWHTVQIRVNWTSLDSGSGNPVNDIVRSSDPVYIEVSNPISYPDWVSLVGEKGIAAYFLKTTSLEADWTIDIKDAHGALVKQLSGHTTDGNITAYWNMVDARGVARTNAAADPEFGATVTVAAASGPIKPMASPASKETPPKKQRENNWPEHGKWTMAYLDYIKFLYCNNDMMKQVIPYFPGTAMKYGGTLLYAPQAGQTTDIGQTWPIRYQMTNHWDPKLNAVTEQLDRQMLLGFLADTNSRNFFYTGHANSHMLGMVPCDMIEAAVKHRYRFVMLHACLTANAEFSSAFGIDENKNYPIDYYQATGIRPGAFCGYDASVPFATKPDKPVTINGVDYDGIIYDSVPSFLVNFLMYWDLQHWGLSDSIQQAADLVYPRGGSYSREYHWIITGYGGLKIDECNYRDDTW